MMTESGTELQGAKLISANQAMKFLGGISKTSLWRLTKKGSLKIVDVGGRTMFDIDELNRFITLNTRR
jgi:predicted DNA-binding transcriptional regulator AlpA